MTVGWCRRHASALTVQFVQDKLDGLTPAGGREELPDPPPVKQEAIREPKLGRSPSCTYFGTGRSGAHQDPEQVNDATYRDFHVVLCFPVPDPDPILLDQWGNICNSLKSLDLVS